VSPFLTFELPCLTSTCADPYAPSQEAGGAAAPAVGANVYEQSKGLLVAARLGGGVVVDAERGLWKGTGKLKGYRLPGRGGPEEPLEEPLPLPPTAAATAALSDSELSSDSDDSEDRQRRKRKEEKRRHKEQKRAAKKRRSRSRSRSRSDDSVRRRNKRRRHKQKKKTATA